MDRFEEENIRRLERNQRANFSSAAASQWLNIRLQALGVVMVTGIALIAVIEHSSRAVDPGKRVIRQGNTTPRRYIIHEEL